jgi:nitrogen fixation NifU-like protein
MLSMYSALLLDHFEHPRNSGEVGNADAAIDVSNPACGDVVRLSVRVFQGRVAELRFRAKGCVPAMACCSVLTELAIGKSLHEASCIGREEVVAAVGGLPEASGHAAHLAVDALAGLLKALAANHPPTRS